MCVCVHKYNEKNKKKKVDAIKHTLDLYLLVEI